MLDKLSGRWAPRPSSGPHKLRECLPLVLLLRNRLRYALSRNECTMIVMQRLLKVDGKVRTDINYPAGFQDVISIEKTGEHYRLLFDTKGRFTLHRLKDAKEFGFKLCKINKVYIGAKGIPYAVTHDARSLRYPNPDIVVGDTVKLDIATGKPSDIVHCDVGNIAAITGGRNFGRVGIIEHKEKHPGSWDIIHVKDNAGHQFSTRAANVFVLGKGKTPLISLPRNGGVKLSVLDEREQNLRKAATLKAVQKV